MLSGLEGEGIERHLQMQGFSLGTASLPWVLYTQPAHPFLPAPSASSLPLPEAISVTVQRTVLEQ